MSELPDYFRYWGKADPKYSGEPKWHPLAYHCLDVAACAKILIDARYEWPDKIARISGLRLDLLSEWLVFLLTIHDIGKFSDGFQCIRSDLQAQLQQRTVHLARGPRHDTVGYELLMTHFPAWSGRDDLAKYGGSALRLWILISYRPSWITAPQRFQ